AHQLINAVDNSRDRQLLTRLFIDDEPASDAQLATLSPVGRTSYDFLSNQDPTAVSSLIQRLPPAAVAELDYLSPRTSIANVKAELFILHDRGATLIPLPHTSQSHNIT